MDWTELNGTDVNRITRNNKLYHRALSV